MSTEPFFSTLNVLAEAQANGHVTFNEAMYLFSVLTRRGVNSRTTTAQPGAPTNGDAYIIPTGATGTDWSGEDGKIGYYVESVWKFIPPKEGMSVHVNDEDLDVKYSGSAWIAQTGGTVVSDITASTTQTQGQGALTGYVNEIGTCANEDDTVTLPAAEAGRFCYVINNGAERAKVYPATGDCINSLSANEPVFLCPGQMRIFLAYDATCWEQMPSQTYVKVRRNALKVVATATPYEVEWTHEVEDPFDQHDTVSNDEDIVAIHGGLKSIEVAIQWQGNATGERTIEILVNGTAVQEFTTGGLANDHVHAISWTHRVCADEAISVRVTQNSGGNLNMLYTANKGPYFQVTDLPS